MTQKEINSYLNEIDSIPVELLTKTSETLGEQFSGKIKTHQIRQFFSTIQKIRQLKRQEVFSENKSQTGSRLSDEIEKELLFLKPKMAYAAGRNKDLKPFYEFVETVVDRIMKAEDKERALDNFLQLSEGIVAYHKYYENSNNSEN